MRPYFLRQASPPFWDPLEVYQNGFLTSMSLGMFNPEISERENYSFWVFCDFRSSHTSILLYY